MKAAPGQCLADIVVQEGGTMEALAAFIGANTLPLVTLPLGGIDINIPAVVAGTPAGTVAALRAAGSVVATWHVPPGIGTASVGINFIIG